MKKLKNLFVIMMLISALSLVFVGCGKKPKPPAEVKYTVEFSSENPSKGTVSASVAGNDISSGDLVLENSSVLFVASANEGYSFSGWYENSNPTPISTSASYERQLTANVSLVAKFSVNEYPLYYSAETGKGSVVEQSGLYNGVGDLVPFGASITLTATANAGYEFAGWEVNGQMDLVQTGLNYTASMPGNSLTVIAKFTKKALILNYSAKDGLGTIAEESGYADGASVYYGAGVKLTATPNEGYKFVGWYDGKGKITEATTNVYAFNMPSENYTVEARFEKDSFMFSFSPEENRGQITEASDIATGIPVLYGTQISLSATAFDGYTFAGWEVDGDIVETSPSYAFTMPAKAMTIIAKYTVNEYPLYYSAESGKGAVLEASGLYGGDGGNVPYGTSVTLTATANEGYAFVGWSVDGDIVETNLTFTFDMPYAQKTVVATFRALENALQYSADGGKGSVLEQSGVYGNGASVPYGTSITLTATENVGYDFAGWEVDGVLDSEQTGLTYTFAMPNRAVSIVAKFNAEKRIVEFYDGYDIVKTEEVDYGAPVEEYKMTKDNYTLLGWYVSPAPDADKYVFSTPVIKALKLYSRWQENQVYYAVDFVYENGTPISTQNIIKGGQIIHKPTADDLIIPTGYEFDNWYYFDADQNEYVVLPSGFVVDENIAITVKFKKITYKVSFYLNATDEVAYAEIPVLYLDKVSQPTTPIKDGFKFDKWVDSLGQAFDFEQTQITASFSLYATFDEETATMVNVKFYKNKEDIESGEAIDTQPVVVGYKATLPKNVTKEGHTLLGWYYELNGVETEFTAETEVNEAINVYAKFEINKFKVTFVDYDGTTILKELNGDDKVSWGTSVATIAPENPTRTGYVFAGWDKKIVDIKEDVVLTATYTLGTVQVTFKDGDSVIGEPISVNYGYFVPVPNTPSKDGFVFSGWFIDDALSTAFDFQTVKVYENTYIFAKFEEEQIQEWTVTFYKEVGEAPVSVQTIVDGKGAIDPGQQSKEGYTFKGWNASFDKVTENIDVVAVFEIIQLEVKFYNEDGTIQIGETQYVNWGSYAVSVAPGEELIPTVENKYFSGWDKNINSLLIKTNTEFYAKYALSPRYVEFYMSEDDDTPFYTDVVEHGGYASMPTTPKKAGYYFTYWYELGGDGQPFEFENTKIESETPIKLVARFERLIDVYVVSFVDPEGVECRTKQEVAKDGYAMKPAKYTDGTSTTYIWCLDGETEEFDFDNIAITGDVVLKAVALPNE